MASQVIIHLNNLVEIIDSSYFFSYIIDDRPFRIFSFDDRNRAVLKIEESGSTIYFSFDDRAPTRFGASGRLLLSEKIPFQSCSIEIIGFDERGGSLNITVLDTKQFSGV